MRTAARLESAEASLRVGGSNPFFFAFLSGLLRCARNDMTRHGLRSPLRLRHADARLFASDGAASCGECRLSWGSELPRPAVQGEALSGARTVGRGERRRVWRALSVARGGSSLARVRHLRGVRRKLSGADAICAPDAAGHARRRVRHRGLDLSLQLAGRAPRPHRVGTVFVTLSFRGARKREPGMTGIRRASSAWLFAACRNATPRSYGADSLRPGS